VTSSLTALIELLKISSFEELHLERRRFFTPLKGAVRLKPHTAPIK